MNLKKERPGSITEYINDAPKAARKKLRQMRACIRKAAPGAKESLKWGMPAFSYHRILVAFAAFEHHIGFYPTPSAVKAFRKELSKFASANSSIQFPLDKPLPLPLIQRITGFRVQEHRGRRKMEAGTERCFSNPFLSAGKRMTSRQGDAQARSTAEAVARRSYRLRARRPF